MARKQEESKTNRSMFPFVVHLRTVAAYYFSQPYHVLFQSHESVVKALAEDPSVFEYDNIYDDLQEKKKKSDPRLQKKDTRVQFMYNAHF